MEYKVHNLWVVKAYDDTDINEVYTERDEAVLNCDKKNKEIERFTHIPNNSYRVVTLDDAIDEIREYVREENDSWGNPGY